MPLMIAGIRQIGTIDIDHIICSRLTLIALLVCGWDICGTCCDVDIIVGSKRIWGLTHLMWVYVGQI